MKRNFIYTLGILVALALSSCNKEVEFFSEPYPEGKENLLVKMDRTLKTSPEFGAPGTEVTIKVTGLEAYKDKAIFNFNGEKAEIVSINDEQIVVKVPTFASTGVTSIYIDDMIVFGPKFTVSGKVNIDPTWGATKGSNGSINANLWTIDEKYIFVGNFSNYEEKGSVKPINKLVRTFRNGTYDISWRTGDGSNGNINSILQYQDHYYISGGFSGYDQRKDNISNITRIHLSGRIDTMGIKPFRRPEQNDTTKYYPTFNGGFDQFVANIYEHNGKIIASGNFRYHINRIYGEPNFMETKDSVILDSTEIRHVARLNTDGTLDKTYRFTGDKAFAGANGSIETFFHDEGPLKGKIVVFGRFNRFDETTVGNIVRLNADGTVDASFNTGSGANFKVNKVTYNPITKKYVVVGEFKSFNGVETARMVLLNEDGSIDNTFKAKSFGNGYPWYAKQLNDGLIVVSGGFIEYGGVAKNRFMFLKPDGSLAEGYNNIGQMNGSLNRIIETTSEDGKRAILLLGSFTRIDDFVANNITRLILE
ncbi:DUF5008 domain-containing protein [Sphingobacterium sp. 1.A.4]|uniref:DUF5008 domain-containing protein n=1 Tax=Sphingobacterium sp. 1.A.4 TaxID=2044603 RepID=UPI000C0BC160|nr:DUF5008 domain-containing protein [Sphingobacterium sp. 1.A.4]